MGDSGEEHDIRMICFGVWGDSDSGERKGISTSEFLQTRDLVPVKIHISAMATYGLVMQRHSRPRASEATV